MQCAQCAFQRLAGRRQAPENAWTGEKEILITLNHEVGLPALQKGLSYKNMRNLESLSIKLAAQKPYWQPGTQHGYHSSTLGMYPNELIRQADTLHRSLGLYLGLGCFLWHEWQRQVYTCSRPVLIIYCHYCCPEAKWSGGDHHELLKWTEGDYCYYTEYLFIIMIEHYCKTKKM